jgi:hypothetical protein
MTHRRQTLGCRGVGLKILTGQEHPLTSIRRTGRLLRNFFAAGIEFVRE